VIIILNLSYVNSPVELKKNNKNHDLFYFKFNQIWLVCVGGEGLEPNKVWGGEGLEPNKTTEKGWHGPLLPLYSLYVNNKYSSLLDSTNKIRQPIDRYRYITKTVIE